MTEDPYRLESYTRGRRRVPSTPTRDTSWAGPFVRRLEHRPVGDELSALEAGEVDAASPGRARPEALEPFRRDAAFGSIQSPPGASMDGLYWNLARAGPWPTPASGERAPMPSTRRPDAVVEVSKAPEPIRTCL